MSIDLSGYMDVFAEEAREHLQALNHALLQFEKAPADLELINVIFRTAHTLKGMSATMGFDEVAELTHQMENLLTPIRRGSLEASAEILELLFGCLDALQEMLEAHIGGTTHAVEIAALVDELVRLAGGVSATAPARASASVASHRHGFILDEYLRQLLESARGEGFRVLQVHVLLSEDCTLKSARAFMVHKRLEQSGEVIATYPDVEDIELERFDRDLDFLLLSSGDVAAVLALLQGICELADFEVQDGPRLMLSAAAVPVQAPPALALQVADEAAPQADRSARPQEKVRQAQTIRVDTERLDGLLTLVGELVIGKTRLTSLARELRSSELSAAIEQIGRIIFDLQSVVKQTRMVPIETVFNRFPRMIRDLAKSRGKQVELVLAGGETELDRTVIDEIGDPLVHLIRNAVDHGIEEPEVRARLGKPPAGTLTLAAFHEGSHVFVQVRDDGAGIDAERIRRKAVEQGLISAEQAAGLSREQALELMFLAGLSTAEQVTDVSGRGVGMDVVRSSIERLSGEIRVATEPGAGSTFTIKLPLTLAIVQALLVRIAGDEYAIPLAYIEETLPLLPAQVQKVNQQDVVQLRGKILPLVWMHRLLGCSDTGRQDGSWLAIVVRSGSKRAGLIVDETLGQTEIVIKTLGSFLQDCKYIAGGTILGDGTVALILDVAHIVG